MFYDQTQGCVQLSGKALDDMEESLISTSHMCEKLGFTQVIRPVCEGRSYFEKKTDGERIHGFRDRGLHDCAHSCLATD